MSFILLIYFDQGLLFFRIWLVYFSTELIGEMFLVVVCLFVYLLFYVPLNIFNIYGDVTTVGEGLQNLGLCSVLKAILTGSDIYRATPTVKWDLGFPFLIRRIAL
jgi:hypothetical protein